MKKKINYVESEDEDDEDEFTTLHANPRPSTRRPQKRRKTVVDNDDEFSHASEAEIFHEGQNSLLQLVNAMYEAYSLTYRRFHCS